MERHETASVDRAHLPRRRPSLAVCFPALVFPRFCRKKKTYLWAERRPVRPAARPCSVPWPNPPVTGARPRQACRKSPPPGPRSAWPGRFCGLCASSVFFFRKVCVPPSTTWTSSSTPTTSESRRYGDAMNAGRGFQTSMHRISSSSSSATSRMRATRRPR